MVTSCIIRGCKTRHAKFSGVKFFSVPRNRQRREHWLSNCPFLRKYNDQQLDNARICSKHFQPHHISGDLKLTIDALPTLHIPSFDQCNTGLFLEIQPIIGTQPLKVKVLKESHETDHSCANINYSPQPVSDPQSENIDVTSQPCTDVSPISLLICNETLADISPDPASPSLSQLNTLIASKPLSAVIKSINQIPISHIDPLSLSPMTPTLPEHIQNTVPSSLSLSPKTPPPALTDNSQASVSVVSHNRSLRSKEYSLTGPRIRLNPNQNTPRKQKLRLENKLLKSKLRQMQLRFQNLKKKSKINNQTAQYIKKYPLLTNYGKILVDSQLRLSDKRPKGRRYTTEEKIFALSLYKLSPKSYAFLRKHIALPCKSNINLILSQIPLRPGINDFVFQHLADTANNKSVIERQCVLLFDEMAISKNLHFNFHSGVIEGFEDLGSGKRSLNVADKALVFMLRGIASPWKMPIAFYFVRDGIKTVNLKNIIREIIKAIFKAGFHVRATVSDQGSANVAAVRSLMLDTRADLLRSDSKTSDVLYYDVEKQKIYHIYDVPHLLKCFRNNFQKKALVIGQQQAKWSHIETLYRVDGHRGMARSTKLTDKHINPQSYDKMKVKLAAQVFSRQVSTSLHMYMKTLQELEDCHNYSIKHCDIESGFFTAEMLMFFNDLFDSLNGCGHHYGGLKNALSANSKHLEFWNDALKKLHSMKFDAPNERESIPLSLKNFSHNIKTMKLLWSDLQNINLKFLSLKRLNQDPLENFFSQIRGQSGFCTNPDCQQFVACFKTLLINNISTGKSLYANCNDDKDDMLGTIENLVNQNHFSTYRDAISHETSQIDTIVVPHENVFQTYAVSYIAGAICRYLIPKLNSANCDTCKKILLCDAATPAHCLIESREYDSNHKKMFYPSQNLSKLVWHSIYVIESLLPQICSVYIYNDLFKAFENLDTTWFNCVNHKIQFFNSFWLFVIRMQVRQWCINFNRRIHKIDSRHKSTAMEDLIASKVTKGASYRSVRRKSN